MSQVPENSEEGFVIGNLSVSDPDNLHEEKQFYNCKVVNEVPFKVCFILFIVHPTHSLFHLNLVLNDETGMTLRCFFLRFCKCNFVLKRQFWISKSGRGIPLR